MLICQGDGVTYYGRSNPVLFAQGDDMFRCWPWQWKIVAVVVLVLFVAYFVWHGLNIAPDNKGPVK